MPTHVFNTDLDSFSEEQIEKLGASRAAILEPAFDEYLMSDDLHETPLPPSSIQLLPASDLSVKLTRAAKSDAAMEININKISDPDADNFMGFSTEDNCIVFKGEMGLFDSFLEFAESITQDKDVTVVFKTANEIRIPRQGLEYGLSYENFAARVELLECAMMQLRTRYLIKYDSSQHTPSEPTIWRSHSFKRWDVRLGPSTQQNHGGMQKSLQRLITVSSP
ncbi:uncharacterized protein NECHADRAFT_80590 [Fusarium vanettenii 77-13-4]|uniref:Uncharacterized protein n=1 Tax=Fusarium vanettenii (strain ATCC MYA-4622 / CBS 123669 / FGSC 9596 / NRRL 45880 / 77-13-4) TaxID=660122 RepID=C7YS26_FUSV7|nr:uncharacterized protein NECHADRAFT_80590 [Fusarium vanettenii 77-13-4]EEU45172.1 hypothetical protein NECHADRAFT_80590 [Fusarium vanettenii 77-13-4]